MSDSEIENAGASLPGEDGKFSGNSAIEAFSLFKTLLDSRLKDLRTT
jgi:hypothetical protein